MDPDSQAGELGRTIRPPPPLPGSLEKGHWAWGAGGCCDRRPVWKEQPSQGLRRPQDGEGRPSHRRARQETELRVLSSRAHRPTWRGSEGQSAPPAGPGGRTLTLTLVTHPARGEVSQVGQRGVCPGAGGPSPRAQGLSDWLFRRQCPARGGPFSGPGSRFPSEGMTTGASGPGARLRGRWRPPLPRGAASGERPALGRFSSFALLPAACPPSTSPRTPPQPGSCSPFYSSPCPACSWPTPLPAGGAPPRACPAGQPQTCAISVHPAPGSGAGGATLSDSLGLSAPKSQSRPLRGLPPATSLEMPQAFPRCPALPALLARPSGLGQARGAWEWDHPGWMRPSLDWGQVGAGARGLSRWQWHVGGRGLLELEGRCALTSRGPFAHE